MPKLGKYNKIILLPEEKKFLKENYQSMTNRQLADALELSLTKTRHFLYEMGLKRMEMEYWTDEQIDFLKKNYKTIGDTELAEIRSEEHTSELQSREKLVCRLLLEKKNKSDV